jgi:predicted porin
MKKATAVLCAFPILSGVAHAQTSVTLYGIVDSGFVYINNQSGHSNLEAINGQTNGSRVGLRGSEDLGGAMKAIFTLENGFDSSNGKLLQGGRLFGRQAYMGLSSKTFGTITLGRQRDSMTQYIGRYISATSTWAWVGTHPGDFDNLNDNFRVNNAVKYVSPSFAGMQAIGLFSPGGVAGNFATNRIYNVALNYASGPLNAALVYDNVNNPSVSAFDGTVNPGEAGYQSPVKSPVFSGYASARSLQIFGAGAAYTFGGAKIGVVYTNTQYRDIIRTQSTPNTGTAIFNSFEINGRYYFTPTLVAGVSLDYTKVRDAKYEQVDVGPDYILSERTELRLVGIWQHASGIDSTGHSAVAAIGSLGQSTTPTQIAVKFGIRHRF